jgi:hypothetical protein
MKSIILLISITFLVNIANAQLRKITDKKGKIGFENTKNQVIVPCQFDWVEHVVFGNNKYKTTCIVKSGNLFGLLNEEGKFLQELKFTDLYVASTLKPYLGFEKDSKHGIIDRNTGKVLIPATYDSKIIFDNGHGLAEVSQNKKYGVLNNSLKQIIPTQYKEISLMRSILIVVKNDKNVYGFFTVSGTLKIPFINEDYGTIQEKVKRLQVKRNGKWGLVDFEGNILSPFEYDAIENFYEGLAVFNKNDKYGYLNLKGKEQFSAQFDFADWFVSGVSFVAMRSSDSTFRNAILKKDGKFLTDYKYDYNYNLFEFGYSLVGIEGKYGIVDIYGNEIVALKHEKEDINPEFEVGYNMYIYIKKDSKVQLFNKKGQALLKDDYDSVEFIELDKYEDIVKVKKGNLSGFVNLKDGKEIIPTQFTGIDPYSLENGDFCWVKSDSGYGVWSLNENRLIVPTNYENLYEEYLYNKSKKTIFIVEKNEMKGAWDATVNKEIIPTKFTSIEQLDGINNAESAYFICYNNKIWSIYNQDGKLIIPHKFSEYPVIFSEKGIHYFVVKDEATSKYGLYSSLGKELLPCIYEEINYVAKGTATVQVDGVSTSIKIQ